MDALILRGERNENGCLLWTGGKSRGYGQVEISGKRFPVHRLMMMLSLSATDLPDGIEVRHGPKCPRSCFEITHLKTGTASQNNYDDKIEAGTLLRGEKSPRAKLTDAQAKEIKWSMFPKDHEDYVTKKVRAKKYTELFGIEVTEGNVSEIDKGRRYAHVPGSNGAPSCNLKHRKARAAARRRAKERDMDENMWLFVRDTLQTKVKESDEINKFMGTKCHLFTGYIDEQGYGKMSVYGRGLGAHVWACAMKNRRFPTKMEEVTRHLCGVEACCNPDHVEFGSVSQNAKDARDHGHKNNKLDMTKAREIRRLFGTTGYTTYAPLSKRFEVSNPTISDIILNKRWVE